MSISSVTPFQPLHPAGCACLSSACMPCRAAWHPCHVCLVCFSKPLPSIRTHLGRCTSHDVRSVIRPAQTESKSKPARKWNTNLQKSQAGPAAINPFLFLKAETPKLSKFHLCHNRMAPILNVPMHLGSSCMEGRTGTCSTILFPI